MKEYKIIVDFDRNKPFLCYEREVNVMWFSSPWEFMDDTPSHQEALDYVQNRNGKFTGTFMKDGTQVAAKDIMKLENERTYTSEGLPVRRVAREEFINDEIHYKQTIMFKKK